VRGTGAGINTTKVLTYPRIFKPSVVGARRKTIGGPAPATPTIENLKNICGFVIVGDGRLALLRSRPGTSALPAAIVRFDHPALTFTNAPLCLRADGYLARCSSKARDDALGRPAVWTTVSPFDGLRRERHRLTFVRMDAYRCSSVARYQITGAS